MLLHPGFVLFVFITSAPFFLPSNEPPEVKILEPANNSTFRWGSLVSYQIQVADREDGMSGYGEINPKDVFMKITFIPDSTHLPSALAIEKTAPEPPGFTLAKVGQCFTCHAAKNRLIGPSWEAISEQYDNNPVSRSQLAHSVLYGSAGKWGTEKMPPTELVDSTRVSEIIQWIFLAGGDKNVDFLPGLSGAFETVQRPEDQSGKAVYLLTAMYTDRGGENDGKQPLQGKSSIVLRSME
jgi:cytochrome c